MEGRSCADAAGDTPRTPRCRLCLRRADVRPRFPRLPRSGAPALADTRGLCPLQAVPAPTVRRNPGPPRRAGAEPPRPAGPGTLPGRPGPRRAASLPARRARCRFSGSALCGFSSSHVPCPGAHSLTVVASGVLRSQRVPFEASGRRDTRQVLDRVSNSFLNSLDPVNSRRHCAIDTSFLPFWLPLALRAVSYAGVFRGFCGFRRELAFVSTVFGGLLWRPGRGACP